MSSTVISPGSRVSDFKGTSSLRNPWSSSIRLSLHPSSSSSLSCSLLDLSVYLPTVASVLLISLSDVSLTPSIYEAILCALDSTDARVSPSVTASYLDFYSYLSIWSTYLLIPPIALDLALKYLSLAFITTPLDSSDYLTSDLDLSLEFYLFL